MSSSKQDSASVGKLKCLDFVETVSDAILKILRNSANEDFIAKCFLNLQVGTPVQAERRLKAQLWRLLDDNDPVNSDLNLKHTQDYHAQNTALDRENLNHEALNLNSKLHLYSFDHVSIGTPQTLQQHHDISFFASELGYTDNVISFNSPTATKLTSTPIEYNEHQVSCDHSYPLIVALDDNFDSDLEILRDTCNNEHDLDSLSDDIECSWESLNLSNIQDFSRPTASDPSLHFSHPEYLNESYLLKDFTDCGESVLQNNDISDFPSSEMDSFGALAVENSSDSHHLVSKALSVLKEGIIKDFDLQDSERPVTLLGEHSSVDIAENFINENIQGRISFARVSEDDDCVEIQKDILNILNNKDNCIESTSDVSNLNKDEYTIDNEVIFLFDSNNEQMHTKEVCIPSNASPSSKKEKANPLERKATNSSFSSRSQYNKIEKTTSQKTSTSYIDTAKTNERSEILDDFDNLNDSDGSFDCYFDLQGVPDGLNDGESTTATNSDTGNVSDTENGIEDASQNKNSCPALSKTFSNSGLSFTCKNNSLVVFENDHLKDLDVDDDDFIW